MSDNKKFTAIVIGVLVLVGLVGYGVAKLTIKQTVNVSTQASPAGATFNTAKIAAVAVNVATVTPASLFNGDQNDRIVTGVFMTGNTPNSYGSSTIQNIQVATSSNQYNLSGNTNYILNQPIQYSLPGDFALGSTTIGNLVNLTGAVNGPAIRNASTTGIQATTLRWPAGTYLNFTISSSTNMLTHLNYSFSGALNASTNNEGNLGSTTAGVYGVTYIPQ